jgi:hypothetical protein
MIGGGDCGATGGATGGMKIGRGNRSTRRKPATSTILIEANFLRNDICWEIQTACVFVSVTQQDMLSDHCLAYVHVSAMQEITLNYDVWKKEHQFQVQEVHQIKKQKGITINVLLHVLVCLCTFYFFSGGKKTCFMQLQKEILRNTSTYKMIIQKQDSHYTISLYRHISGTYPFHNVGPCCIIT